MRKLNIEIHPYATKGLSPRHHIPQTQFRRLREEKMDKLNERCESCGGWDEKMELHESGSYKNKTYILKGFFLLCQKCHDMVHCIQLPSNMVGMSRLMLDVGWRMYDIRRRTRFKTKADMARHSEKAFDRVFDFMMSDRVSCDYSMAKKYGLDPRRMKRGFKASYDHFSCRIRYMVNYLRWFLYREERGWNEDPKFYKLYADPKKVKRRQAILYQEYLKHKDYYAGNKILFGNASPEREKVILDYAETMRMQLTASKYKPKTKSK